MDEELKLEQEYLKKTLKLVSNKLDEVKQSSNKLEGVFDQSNEEYFEYLKRNANKINEEDVVELVNIQGRLDDLQQDSIDNIKAEKIYEKMLAKPYFSSIKIRENDSSIDEKYYIGISSLIDDNKEFRVIDWRSPIASIFYDYEKGACKITTNSSILKCNLLGKRQYGISDGKLNYYFDSSVNIEDEILMSALGNNASSHMKSIVETIQREQNAIIRGDENKNLIVQGVAGSGKTAIALHRIAYLIYKMKGKVSSDNFAFISPNNAFSSYISSVLPDLAEDDIVKFQLDLIARKYLKKHLILERKYEQIERLISSENLEEFNYKTSFEYLNDILDFFQENYIQSFHIDTLIIRDIEIDVKKVKNLFFDRYADRDLFTRIKWITDNIYDLYFFKYKKPEVVVKIKELIFKKLYSNIDNKNCVKAYLKFLESKGLKLELVGDKVKNEDAYGILLFKLLIMGVEKYDNIKHLVIDEMQDYSPIQLYILNMLFDCSKTILGDYNQTLNIFGARDTLNRMPVLLKGDSQIIELAKSYRSTVEISDFYNFIGGKKNVVSVSRHGDEVEFLTTNSVDCAKNIVKTIGKYKEMGYNSIGIITKTNQLAQKLYREISLIDDEVSLIDDNIDGYDNRVCIISAFNSKGLEFDGVIVIDGDKIFATDIDRNLLYIASSRPLHKLSIISIDNPSQFVAKYKETL